MEEERALTLTNGINQFSAQFYKETAATLPDKNLVMSPLSADIILALLSLGARGLTQKELHASLFLPDEDFTKQAFGPAIARLNGIQGVTLKVANKIFVKDGEAYVLSPDFKKLAVDIFSSEAQNVDFSLSAKAAQIINTWVEEKTNNRIKDLISSDSLDSDTRLVLVNAIYFKGNWDKKFDPARTEKRDFHLNNKDKIQVDMMHQTGNFPYADIPEWNAKVIELPYEKKEMSMVIILPNEIEGLKSIEDKLAAGANLTEILQRTHKVEVSLALPKFKIETTIDLKKVLPKLGMARIFSRDADLSGLLQNSEPLIVSDAIQKAFIEVNEEGAEAAAATGMILMCRMLPMQMQFAGDRPFYYAIVAESKALFVGRVTNPTQESQ